ncbi:VWA domain-containing protein [candidate division KSB1 bacterium]
MNRFAHIYYLILLILVPLLIYWYFLVKRKKNATLKYSDLSIIKNIGKVRRSRKRDLLFILRIIAVILLIVALSRPQSGSKEENILTEGIDIIVAVDISSSMLAEDFKPKNRLEAAKIVAADFIKGRKNDRIGMVVFAGKSYTQCPLTLDYGILLKFIEYIDVGLVEDGTAIGMALANCALRLKDSKAESKVVILLTDGKNNRGEIDPLTASKIAKSFNIRIYTIGAGKRGTAMYPVNDPIFGKRYVPMPVEIDEDLLQNIAAETGGKYFRATDTEKLKSIFNEIGEMEKTKIEIEEYTKYSEKFAILAIPGLLLLLIEFILANTVFRKIP